MERQSPVWDLGALDKLVDWADELGAVDSGHLFKDRSTLAACSERLERLSTLTPALEPTLRKSIRVKRAPAVPAPVPVVAKGQKIFINDPPVSFRFLYKSCAPKYYLV